MKLFKMLTRFFPKRESTGKRQGRLVVERKQAKKELIENAEERVIKGIEKLNEKIHQGELSISYNDGTANITLNSPKNKPMARLTLRAYREGEAIGLSIEEIQGINSGEPTKSNDLQVFESFNKPWNIFMTQSVIDIAYEQGFDRVRLIQPESLFSYNHPYLNSARERELGPKKITAEKKRISARIRQLYSRTKKTCDFNSGEETIRNTGERVPVKKYWVRKFP